MTLLASDVMSDARLTLIDADAETWTDDELLGLVSDAQQLLCNYKPDAYTKHEFVPMVAGTNQDIPADGTQLLKCTDNEVSGRAATMVDDSMLDTENRFWRAATGERDVQHWAADTRDPRRFDITPPNDGTGSLRVLYCAVPPALTNQSDELVLVDTYKYAVYAMTLHRAYAQNSRRGDVQKSDYWLNKALQAIGIKSSAVVAIAPKLANSGDA